MLTRSSAFSAPMRLVSHSLQSSPDSEDSEKRSLAQASPSPWCQVVFAYAWMNGNADFSSLASRLQQDERSRVSTFQRNLEKLGQPESDRFCRRILAFAGLRTLNSEGRK